MSFIGKIKEDVINIFRYPAYRFGSDFHIDYDIYWNERDSHLQSNVMGVWQKERAHAIEKIIRPNSTVLEIGCGNGLMLKYLKDKLSVNGIGVDFSPAILDAAERLGIQTIQMDISKPEELQTLPSVDYIIGCEVIEHLANAEQVMFALSKKAKEGMIFSVPNTGYYVHRLRLLFGRFPLQWRAHPGEHVRFWTVRDLKRWVRAMPYHMRELVLYQGVPILNKVLPGLFAQGMLFFLQSKKH